jgi:glycosyltransferase involved in cell wall biosynthesis
MRVLYCTDTYPPQVNGVSVVTALSVDGLAARGWDCAVVAPRYPIGYAGTPARTGGSAASAVSSLPSVPLPFYPETRLSAPDYLAVHRTIRRFAPDLVHCETEFIIGALGQIAARRLGVPVVSSYHTNFAKYAVEYGLPVLEARISAWIARFHRRNRRTYTPSRPAHDYLRALGVRDVEVWGRGVDTRAFHPQRRSEALRQQLGGDDAMLFLHAGRLAAEKGVDRVLAAYQAAREMAGARQVRLVIAGGGPQESAIRAAAPEDVVFLGYLDRERELPQLYASCDAFVFASLTETLGLVVLEAMASGLPVIAPPAGGVADHLRDGENGIACAPHDSQAMARAMLAVASDVRLRGTLAHGARATAEALSWDAELDRLDASYRDVCADATAATASPQRAR